MAVSLDAQMGAIDLICTSVVDALSRELGVNPDVMLSRFLQSETAAHLYDPSLKYWCDGPAYIVDEYLAEISA